MKLNEDAGVFPLSGALFYILVSLADGDRNGATITREVEELTQGMVTLPPGTLYRLIKRLVADRWIVEVGSEGDDLRVRQYRLTARGRKIASVEATRLEDLVRISRGRNLLAATGRV